jgi:hypothetical protein
MGASASRIWTEICAMESDDVRSRMITTVLQSPELVVAAQQAGLYTTVSSWLAGYRAGLRGPFPYATSRRDTIQHDSPRWSMYTTPVQKQQQQQQQQQQPHYTAYQESQPQALIVSPAAKALDYFQEALHLLGIDEHEELTTDRLRRGYKQAAIRAHPDKGGSKEAFDEVARAYKYVEKILARISGQSSSAEKARMTAAVTMENARAVRESAAPAIPDAPPVQLSAKKLDVSMFNRLFEENRLPDPTRDSGYGDWLKGQDGSDDVAADPRLRGKFSQEVFESVFREKAVQQTAGTAIMRRLEPDAVIAAGGTELGGDVGNFTAAFGSDTQFTDLKEAYTTGATRFQEVADVRVQERSARSVEEAEALRAREMSRVDPDESTRIAAAAASLEERERQRRLRLAKQDTAQEIWADAMKRRLLVNHG